MLPPEALLTYRRFSDPATQRTPCPKTTPETEALVPESTMLVAVGFSAVVTKTRLSAASEGVPPAPIVAPPVPALLSQPRSGPTGGLAQGQAITPARPGEQELTGAAP